MWAAAFRNDGKGVLRFLTVDASKIEPSTQIAQNKPSQIAPPVVQPPNVGLPTQQSQQSKSAPAEMPPNTDRSNGATYVPNAHAATFPYKVEGEKAVVEVTGVGGTLSEARMDAIRLALQRTMQQLIVVDRVIKNDQIVVDKIMSTLNGYVEDFKEIEVQHQANTVSIKAEVTVSPTRIENFAKAIGGSVNEIQGGNILGEAQREIEARAVRGQIFGHLFRGFPNDAIDLNVTNARPAQDNPQLLELTLSVKSNERWIRQLRAGLEFLLGQKVFETGSQKVEHDIGLSGPNVPRCLYVKELPPPANTVNACVIDSRTSTLYFLPLGDYDVNFIRFLQVQTIDGLSFPKELPLSSALQTRLNHTKGKCLPVELNFINMVSAGFESETGARYYGSQSFHYLTLDRQFNVRIPIAAIDLASAEQVSAALLIFDTTVRPPKGNCPDRC